MIGRVVSVKIKGTATVLVNRVAMHPLYKKTFLRSKKYLTEAGGEIKEGDIVEIVKVKPISKNKHFKIAKVLGKNLAEINEEKLKAEAEGIIAEVMPEEKEELDESLVKENKAQEDEKTKKAKIKKGKVLKKTN